MHFKDKNEGLCVLISTDVESLRLKNFPNINIEIKKLDKRFLKFNFHFQNIKKAKSCPRKSKKKISQG